MSQGFKPSLSREVEDALMYLPRKGVTDFNRGDVIFDENNPSKALHLVVQGRVKVTIPVDNGCQTVVDIFNTDDFFGESSLLGAPHVPERAVALDSVTLMSWTRAEIEEQVERQPRLGIALMQMLVKRGLDYEERLQSFALDKTPERIIRALLRFADHLGAQAEDGSLRIPPLTHQAISEYVGTSREIVTFQMNHLRQKGYLRYSRRGIQVYSEALREHLNTSNQRHGETAAAE
ncbi:MAG TPA: Crp/Fnr family transcriptional regulator [Bryobacteraceae bacterium]|jgi:CRP/FNR family transcriptional regulator|nr:Crp/Fnr family transcriptional regulator [Bryobacteraceae bacterium]